MIDESPRHPAATVTLPGGRRLGFDDLGDGTGRPVLYLHGTPDSRLARHPDADALARGAGVRLVCPDRPGIGSSSPDPAATPVSVADDLVAMLDALGIDRVGVASWSAGSIFAAALAGRHPHRVTSLVLAAPLIPADAYGDDGVLDGADDGRLGFAAVLDELSPDELGIELAPYLVPPELDRVLAEELLAGPIERSADIAGAKEQLVDALLAVVVQGLTGLERDITAQATPLGSMLDAISGPVTIHAGATDATCPPAMARWWAGRLGATVIDHPGGHEIALRHWSELVAAASS